MTDILFTWLVFNSTTWCQSDHLTRFAPERSSAATWRRHLLSAIPATAAAAAPRPAAAISCIVCHRRHPAPVAVALATAAAIASIRPTAFLLQVSILTNCYSRGCLTSKCFLVLPIRILRPASSTGWVSISARWWRKSSATWRLGKCTCARMCVCLCVCIWMKRCMKLPNPVRECICAGANWKKRNM